MGETNIRKFDPLSGSNDYQRWKTDMKIVLFREDTWDLVFGSIIEPTIPQVPSGISSEAYGKTNKQYRLETK